MFNVEDLIIMHFSTVCACNVYTMSAICYDLVIRFVCEIPHYKNYLNNSIMGYNTAPYRPGKRFTFCVLVATGVRHEAALSLDSARLITR